MIDLFVGVIAFLNELTKNELLHMVKVMWVSTEGTTKLGYVSCLHFLLQQIRLVKKKDNGYMPEAFIVDNCIKDIQAFDHSICRTILHECLIKGTGCNEENDGCDLVKALKPFGALGALSTHINHKKWHSFHLKIVFTDASCGLS
jgi:hypothetical protein